MAQLTDAWELPKLSALQSCVCQILHFSTDWVVSVGWRCYVLQSSQQSLFPCDWRGIFSVIQHCLMFPKHCSVEWQQPAVSRPFVSRSWRVRRPLDYFLLLPDSGATFSRKVLSEFLFVPKLGLIQPLFLWFSPKSASYEWLFTLRCFVWIRAQTWNFKKTGGKISSVSSGFQTYAYIISVLKASAFHPMQFSVRITFQYFFVEYFNTFHC